MDNNTVTYSQINPSVLDFISNVKYDPSDTATSCVCEYADRVTDYDKSKPFGITLSLPEGELEICDGYTDITYRKKIHGGDVTIVNVTPGTDSKYTVTSDERAVAGGTLRPTGFLRMIDCGDNASNVRDLGGWPCDGGTVKYGKLFRGSEVTEEARDVLVGQCGVRAELELRGINEIKRNSSVLGDDIDFFLPIEHQYYSLYGKKIWISLLRYTFDCVAAEKPMYFHCAAGADRTGTFACIIEAILGVSRSDIDLDYELTNFALAPDRRLRNCRNAWGALLYEIYEELPPAPTLRDRVIRWVASLGFTEEEINSFRQSMIDGTPDIIDLDKLNHPKTFEYSQINPAVNDFLNEVTYDPADHESSRIKEYALRDTDYDKAKPLGISIHTDGGLLTVHDRYTHIHYTEEVPAGDTRIVNITPATGGEYTLTRNGEIVDFGVLQPSGFLRMIDCGDAVDNVRDLGGWPCDGGTVRYGKLFRGALFGNAEDARKILVDRCGVRAELDLRGADEVTYDHSVLGRDIDFCLPPEHQFYSVSRANVWRPVIRFIFDCVSANKPLYFHCAGGADRTGTCACVIEALLGMSRSDIDRDYELTSFKMTDAMRLRSTTDAWGALMHELYEELPPAPTLRDRVARWIVGLGFTEDEINSFRQSMIDGTPEPIVLSAE